MWYSKNLDRYIDESFIDDLDFNEVKDEDIVFDCYPKQVVKLDLLDLIQESLYDEFGEEVSLKSNDYNKLESLQKEIDKVLNNYQSMIPNFNKPIKLKSLLEDT